LGMGDFPDSAFFQNPEKGLKKSPNGGMVPLPALMGEVSPHSSKPLREQAKRHFIRRMQVRSSKCGLKNCS